MTLNAIVHDLKTNGLQFVKMMAVIVFVGFVTLMVLGSIFMTPAAGYVRGGGPPPLYHTWPPILGQKYPDLSLRKENGIHVHLSDFAGKVILLQPLWYVPQRVIPISPEWLGKHDVVLIHLLMFGSGGELHSPPSREDIQRWSKRFQTDNPHTVVLAATKSLSYHSGSSDVAAVPRFHLIGPDFTFEQDWQWTTSSPSDLDDFLHRVESAIVEPTATITN